MANIRKTFNFRNGVQVDDDNLVVNPLGLVGIGTTIPTEILDVRGTAKVVGLVTADQVYTPSLTASTATIQNLTLGASIIGGGVSISSGIITASGSGVVTYYGDGGRLLNLPTSQWLDVDVGLGFTSVYATGFVGVQTNDPRYALQIAGSNDLGTFTNGVGIDSIGNIRATGIVTASQFSGIGSNLTLINADNISSGTISTDRIPQLPNSKLPTNINSSGIITASGGFSGNLTGNVTGNLTGNVTGNLVGIASTARTLIGNPNILVNNVTATSIAVTSIGSTNINVSGILTTATLYVGSGGTAVSLTSDSRIGIGSAAPTKDLQILKTGITEIEVVGSTQAQIVLGQQKTTTLGIGASTAVIRFGNTARAFDLINGDQGDFNYYLHSGTSTVGVETGGFKWFWGQNIAAPLMTLTYGGDLGIGKTNPDNKLHVVGTSTVTGNAFFGGDVSISGTLNVGSLQLPSLIQQSNIFTNSGVSTFYNLTVQNIAQFSSIGIGTTNPIQNIDARTSTALLAQVGLGSTAPRSVLDVNGQSLFTSVGIGTTTSGGNALVVGNPGFGGIVVYDSSVETYNTSIVMDDTSNVGIGTTFPRSAVDFADAGTNLVGGAYRYMLPPRLTTAQRVGLSTVEGAFIFNTDTKKFQGYTGVAWTDFH